MEQVDFNAPTGWSWKKFKDVCVLKRGYDLPTHARSAGGFPLYSANGVTDYIDQYKVDGPGVVTGRSGTIGKVHFVEGDYWPLNTALYVQKFNGNHPRFIKYFLENFDLTRFASGAAVPTLNRNSLSAELVCVPDSVDEQKRIVEKLDALLTRIDTAIEHLQESVALADALFESSQSEIFNDVLSNYQHSTIDEICIVTSSKRIFKADYVESGIPFYRTKEIVDLSKEKNISTELFIDKEKFSEICGKFGAPKKGDLLFSAVGTIGVMWIVDEREFYFKDGNLLWLKDMNGVTPEYLKSAISAVLTEKIKDRSQGAAYKAISITNLKAFEIPLPSIEEQKSIVAKIEHVSSVTKKTKQELSLQINDLHNLKASILDSAFKGEL